jgi:hypothetical protein
MTAAAPMPPLTEARGRAMEALNRVLDAHCALARREERSRAARIARRWPIVGRAIAAAILGDGLPPIWR